MKKLLFKKKIVKQSLSVHVLFLGKNRSLNERTLFKEIITNATMTYTELCTCI